MRERFARFMAGRNGNDELNRFLLIADIILLLIAGLLSRFRFGGIFYMLVLALLGFYSTTRRRRLSWRLGRIFLGATVSVLAAFSDRMGIKS